MLPNDVITRDCILVTNDGKKIPLRIDQMNFDPCMIGPEIIGHLMLHREIFVSRKNSSPIKKVIFNDPATIVIWNDDTKTIVKCQPGDTYSKELGLAMCISKKYLGNKGNFNEEFKKWIPEEKTNEPYVGECGTCKYDYKSEFDKPCIHCNHNNGNKNHYRKA